MNKLDFDETRLALLQKCYTVVLSRKNTAVFPEILQNLGYDDADNFIAFLHGQACHCLSNLALQPASATDS